MPRKNAIPASTYDIVRIQQAQADAERRAIESDPLLSLGKELGADIKPPEAPRPAAAQTAPPLEFVLPDINYAELANAGHNYATEGYSVVPVWGDLRTGQESKAPAVFWEKWQDEIASPAIIDSWFLDYGFGGIAIVTGRVSNVVILDFDSIELAERFALECPDLTETHTTLSAGKGLPHYRYTPPPGAGYAPAGKFGILELKGEGQIAVAYPTVIGGKSYRVIRGGKPLPLNDEQWARMHAFIAHYASTAKPTSATPATQTRRRTVGKTGVDALASYYESRIHTLGGRAHALLDAACQGRDNRYSQTDVEQVLVPAYVTAAPIGAHVPETAAQREKQARSIIASAYSRPARKPSRSIQAAPTVEAVGLPTSAREHLLQLKCIAAARVIDCLLLLKWTPGHVFTEKQAVEACKPHGISRKVVRAALQDAKRFFAVIQPDELTANDGKGIFVPVCHGWIPEQSSIVRVSKGDKKSKRGRPATACTVYVMPDAATICKILDVDNLGSDPITLDDLRSVKLYREAINRGLIARRPAKYKKHDLGKRIGVTARTAHRYLKDDEQIQKTPQYKPVAILTKADYEEILAREVYVNEKGKTTPGLWVCVDGQYNTKYKPLVFTVKTLVKRHWLVELIKQDVNHYSIKETPSAANEGVA